MLGKDFEWVNTVLKENGISKIDDVFFAQIDENGFIYIDQREDYV